MNPCLAWGCGLQYFPVIDMNGIYFLYPTDTNDAEYYKMCKKKRSDACPNNLPLKIPYPDSKLSYPSIRHLVCIMLQYEVGRIDRPIMAGLAELRMGIGMGGSRRVCHGTRLDRDVAGRRSILLTIPAIDLGLGVGMTKHVVGWSAGCERPVVHDVRGGGR